jgi:iron complex transport system substrate-binding protein
MRIASLIASATEIVCALGLRDQLVGISHECDFPSSVLGLPVLTESNINSHAESQVIDHSIREILQNGMSVYNIRTAILQKLKPDLVITQDQCEICAVSLKDVEKALCSLVLPTTRLCTLQPNFFRDILSDIQRVADMADVPERGVVLTGQIQRRVDFIIQRVKKIEKRPTVACVEWLDPLMIAGGWMPELAEWGGGKPILIQSRQLFSKPTWNDLLQADPDIMVILPCGYDLPRTLQELGKSPMSKTLGKFRASHEGRCFLVDGNAYFNRPGPRIAESIEILAYLLHPTLFNPPDLPSPFYQVWKP